MSERRDFSTLQMLFKRGMRQQASSVCVITTIHERHKHGMTAASISSFCAEPPSVLVCINRTASLHAPIRAAGRFAINVPSRDQRDVAQRFSGPGDRDRRFDESRWCIRDGWAYLDDACVSFLLTTEVAFDHHSHSIMIGRVNHVLIGDDPAQPLIYHDGHYAHLSPLDV